VSHLDFLAAVRADGAAPAAAARRGLDPEVPACPGWTVADLVLHTGMVHRHKLEIVRGRLAAPPSPWPPPAPDRRELLDWYGRGLDGLVTVLDGTDPQTPVWIFRPRDRTVASWGRPPATRLGTFRDPAVPVAVRALAAEATR
jgi:Mycothiol maleylpyruvate isomerase N-terminal domain